MPTFHVERVETDDALHCRDRYGIVAYDDDRGKGDGEEILQGAKYVVMWSGRVLKDLSVRGVNESSRKGKRRLGHEKEDGSKNVELVQRKVEKAMTMSG